jgi:hypothetical protein
VTIHLLGTVLVVAAGGVCALGGFASAQAIVAPTPIERSMDAVPGAPSTLKYDGVVPAPGPRGKNPLPAAPGGGPHLVWTGFQMTASGSRVFLQTTEQVSFDVEEGHPSKSGKSTMVVRLNGCRIHMANNRRKIDTRYFPTPVSGVSARQRGHNVEVRIVLREPVSATPHAEPGPDGTQFLVMDFPPGSATPEPSALESLGGGGDGSAQAGAADGADLPRKKLREKAAK